MIVTSKEQAWAEVNKLFPTDYEKDEASSLRAGYDIYRHPTLNYYNRICDLGCRLEVLTGEYGENVTNIWIKDEESAVATETAASETVTEQSEFSEVRKETGRRLQRLTYWYTEEYIKELDNKAREDAAVKEMQDNNSPGEIKCMILMAENNAKVMLGCITDCIHAVNILGDKEQDIDDWMLAGINAMLDKANESHIIPFDLPLSINGLLCTQHR
jgi:hypothetical protein